MLPEEKNNDSKQIVGWLKNYVSDDLTKKYIAFTVRNSSFFGDEMRILEIWSRINTNSEESNLDFVKCISHG